MIDNILRRIRIYGLTEEEYKRCIPLIKKQNYDSFRITVSLGFCLFFCLLLISIISAPIFKIQNLCYLVGFLSELCLFILSKKKDFCIKYINLLFYLLLLVLFSITIFLYLFRINDYQNGTSFIVLVVTLPLLFIDNPFHISIITLIAVCIYSIISYQYKNNTLFYVETTTAFIFLSISIALHIFFSRIKIQAIISLIEKEDILQKLEAAQKHLTIRAETDHLSGLYNREKFIEASNTLFKSQIGTDKLIYFGIMDLDKFKNINDTYGHQIGDDILRHTASILKNCLRDRDISGRLGGDEFIFILNDIKSIDNVDKVINRIFDSLATTGKDFGFELRSSIGLSKFPENGSTFDLLYQNADEALYCAKEAGRGTYRFYK